MVGYIEGALYVNPDITVNVFFTGSYTDAARAKDLAKTALNAGADVLHPVSGSESNGYIEAAMEAGKLAIGVDSDQYEVFKAEKPDLANAIVTSVLKYPGNSLKHLLGTMLDGTYEWSRCKWYGVAENGVGIAINDRYNALVFAEDKAVIEDITAKIKSGEIIVSTAYGMTSDELNAIINQVR